ncbi:hypothetical protein C8F04DRAFT_1405353 [Mycena alexandri]|uniref:Uncharacterized protein n=1 Tax=Mycena alexandri TaxID=1745969 RepID=A0AAD6RYN9_9AGAR|nr:hypothetical protein C8F04DRAFT_1405353 [Mycena alexandri]
MQCVYSVASHFPFPFLPPYLPFPSSSSLLLSIPASPTLCVIRPRDDTESRQSFNIVLAMSFPFPLRALPPVGYGPCCVIQRVTACLPPFAWRAFSGGFPFCPPSPTQSTCPHLPPPFFCARASPLSAPLAALDVTERVSACVRRCAFLHMSLMPSHRPALVPFLPALHSYLRPYCLAPHYYSSPQDALPDVRTPGFGRRSDVGHAARGCLRTLTSGTPERVRAGYVVRGGGR